MPVRFTLRELEVFCAIARQENVNRAAEALAMTQSAASQALARLEEALDNPLFDRHGRRLVLNENGRLLLPRAQALLDQADDIQGLLRQGDDGAALSLKLAASTTIANYLLPAHLAALRRAYPLARVALTVGNTGEVIAAVAALEVDFGLIEGPSHHPDLHVEPWREDELVVFASARDPLASASGTLEQLADAPWLLREPGSGTREEVERGLLPLLGRLNIDMELGDSEAIKRAVAAGLGVSCLSGSVIADLLASGQVVALTDRVPGLTTIKRQLHCIRHRDRGVTRGMARFLDIAATV